jgi:hypothetical protein
MVYYKDGLLKLYIIFFGDSNKKTKNFLLLSPKNY